MCLVNIRSYVFTMLFVIFSILICLGSATSHAQEAASAKAVFYVG
jgi:phosphotransferase system  glucose/maltose/N-acetylglucosamine-specific IIC component